MKRKRITLNVRAGTIAVNFTLTTKRLVRLLGTSLRLNVAKNKTFAKREYRSTRKVSPSLKRESIQKKNRIFSLNIDRLKRVVVIQLDA
ncbi:unnamed protein product [Anisakis simplex]|uniref:50S ribosomal protein L28 n=1 Tax=Anisakis simplex TaxID=6269 RepID=A0A0M3KJ58_ANISI|nr:unnamed protein product [Anisakis simplex]